MKGSNSALVNQMNDSADAAASAVRQRLVEMPAELRARTAHAVSELAQSMKTTAKKQHKLAKREARVLYRNSSATIKRNPWRTVGIALLAGAVAGAVIASTRHE